MESLYRKYRPQTFESMVGQKHIVSTLQNALTDGRMAHAYLFTGPRGTGKTTTARLLAKALMCEAGGGAATAHPDGTCEQCQEIARGTHPDVYELDAASRTGVDNVRDEIINRVAFAPTQGRYKVYVIDEVHMLTTAAFNALLKTLEEPPAHVVFVLCTTDPQKIPETVLSRCQRLEFHRISDADIAERLEFVCTSEGFEYDSEALALVARHARGGLRDALSTLETLSVHGRGTVRVEDARELLGEVADDTLSGMAELVAARDVAGCFARVDEMSSRGMDIEQYVRDFTRHMRNVYVAAVAGKGALRDAARPEEFVAQAAKFGGADRLAYILDLLGGLENTLRTSTDQRLDFEVALTRMARPKADLSLEALAARVEALEAELVAVKAGGIALASAPAAAAGAQAAGVGQPGGGAAAQAAGSKLPSFARMPQQSAAAAQAAPAASAPMVRPAAPAVPAPVARLVAPSAPAGQPAAQPAATTAPAPVAQHAVPQAPSAPAAPAGASQLPSFARMPQQGAASAAPAAPQQPAASAAVAPQASDAHWGQICQEACAIFRPVIALLNKVTGHFDPDGSLVIVNPGGDFIGKQLQTPNSMNAIKQAAEKVMGHAVAIRVEGAGAAPGRSVRPAAPAAASVQTTPAARPSFSAQPRQSAASPAAAAAASARDAALPAFARIPQQSAPAAQPAAPAASAQSAALPSFARMPQASQAAPAAQPAISQPAPAARDAALPAFARMPQATSTAPAPATANSPAAPVPMPAAPAPQPVAPVDDAPAFEFVPDDMYDGYQDVSADVPADGYGAPWDEPAPAEAQPAAPAPAPRPAAPAPAPRPATPQQPAGFGSTPAAFASVPAASAAPAFAASVQPAVSAPAAQPAFAARPASPAQPASPTPAAQPAAPAPGATFGSPAQSAPGEDSTAWLSQLLEAGFGQPVKVTRE